MALYLIIHVFLFNYKIFVPQRKQVVAVGDNLVPQFGQTFGLLLSTLIGLASCLTSCFASITVSCLSSGSKALFAKTLSSVLVGIY